MPKAASSKGREESAILGKRENSKDVGKDKKAQEIREVLVWLHAPKSSRGDSFPSAARDAFCSCVRAPGLWANPLPWLSSCSPWTRSWPPTVTRYAVISF